MKEETFALTAPEPKAETLLEVIARAVCDPRIDVEKMERLLEMQRTVAQDQRRVAFAAAMARLQEQLPQIAKFGQAKNSKFAKLEDIDMVIRPLLSKEGFSFSFDEESHTDKTITFLATITHAEGHSEAKRLTVPIDVASKNREGVSIRPAIQDMGSTVSYARRYLIKMHLNIIERNEDTNGEDLTTLSADQAKDLDTMIIDVGADKKRFLQYMGVSTVEEILLSDLTKAITALNAKRTKK